MVMGFVNNARTNAAFVSVPEIVTLPRTSTAPSLGGWMTKFRVVPSTSIKPSHGEGGNTETPINNNSCMRVRVHVQLTLCIGHAIRGLRAKENKGADQPPLPKKIKLSRDV